MDLTLEDRYQELGVSSHVQDPKELYLDMVKRAVCNLIYEDAALWRYDSSKTLSLLNRFDLEARVLGEDLPTEAHTMIGWRRLSNIQECAASIFKEGVRGDFVETGVYRGGSTIFMRALLKVYGSADRKVYACDTFVFDPPSNGLIPRAAQFLIAQLMKPAVRIRNESWRMALFRFLEKQQKSFPGARIQASIGSMPIFTWRLTPRYCRHWGGETALVSRRSSRTLPAMGCSMTRWCS